VIWPEIIFFLGLIVCFLLLIFLPLEDKQKKAVGILAGLIILGEAIRRIWWPSMEDGASDEGPDRPFEGPPADYEASTNEITEWKTDVAGEHADAVSDAAAEHGVSTGQIGDDLDWLNEE
jgi:hypothetical protein